jgi:hypothetical protein
MPQPSPSRLRPKRRALVGESPLRLVKWVAEFRPIDEVKMLPRRLRGIYVLYKQHAVQGRKNFNVLYVGMVKLGGIRGRLEAHSKSERKKGLWTHFSAYVVWENIRDEEVAELEGLFRHIYRKDSQANSLNIQKGFSKVKRVRFNNLKAWPWKESGPAPSAIKRRAVQ